MFAVAFVVLNVNSSINRINRMTSMVEFNRNYAIFIGLRDMGARHYHIPADDGKHIIYFVDFETTDAIARSAGFLSLIDHDLTRDQLQRLALSGSSLSGWTPQPPELVGGLDAEQQAEIASNFKSYTSTVDGDYCVFLCTLMDTFDELREEGGLIINDFDNRYNFENFVFSTPTFLVPFDVMIYLIEHQGYEVR